MRAQNDPLFSLTDVTKTYDGKTALRIDSLNISAGGIWLIAGPNGSGKTTFLEILAGLLDPSSGTVLFRGEALFPGGGAVTALRKSLAMVLQNPFLYATSVERMVSLGLRFRKAPPSERKARVDDALKALNVAHLRRRRTPGLSGGERQRVAVASAIALNPPVLILDEPLSNVDDATSGALLAFLRRLADSTHVTIILSTHDLGRCLGITDAEIYLEDGVIKPLPLPNLLRGAIIMKAGEPFFSLPNVPLIRVNASTPGPAKISIPPDSVILSREPFHSSVRNSLPAVVTASAPASPGAIELTLDAGFELRTVLTPQSAEQLRLRPGEKVLASFKSSAVRVFQLPPRTD